MKIESRIKKCMKNSVFSVVGYVFTILSSFLVRTVFICTLSSDYLGINGLFTNILAALSLVELGIGNAMTYYLYEPLATKNYERIKELIAFYRNAYYIVAGVIGAIGVGLLPFIDLFMKVKPDINENLSIIYLLYLLNSVISYLLIYKNSLIIADQKEYIVTVIGYFYTLFMSVIQIIVLLYTHDFLLFLLVQILSSVIQNIVISLICNKKYSFIKNNHSKLGNDHKKIIFRDIRALSIYRVASIVVNSTDNLFISRFVGIVAVGLYSNYYLIIHSIYMLIRKSIIAVTASIGNFNVSGSVEKKNLIYRTVNFISSWLFGLSSICLIILLNPFIECWIGSKYLLDYKIIIVLVFNFYITGLSGIFNVMRGTYGLFTEGKLRPIISSIINIISSLILVQNYGAFGVFLGTSIAYLSINIWYDPYVVYKHVFDQPVRKLYVKNILYIMVTLSSGIALIYISSFILLNSRFTTILARFFVCVIGGNCLFIIAYHRTSEFKYLMRIVYTIILRKNKKNVL
jgi:O-antigen/teichoic acid export membrane protein